MAWYENIDTVKKHRLGTRRRDIAGNEYVYMAGVASLAAKDVVAFDENYATTRLLQATIGGIAVSMAANTSTTNYSWFMIWGKVTSVPVAASFAADQAATFATATPGTVDDSGAGHEEVITGMFGRSAIASGTATFELRYPVKGAAALD